MVVTSQQKEPGVGKKSVEKLVFAMAKPKVGFNEYICTKSVWVIAKFLLCIHMWGCHLDLD